MSHDPTPRTPRLASLRRWFDTDAPTPGDASEADEDADRIDLWRVLPFVGLHLGCVAVAWVGASWFAVGVAAALYAVRMFAITGF